MGVVFKDASKITVISYVGAAIGYLNRILLFTNIFNPAQVGLLNTLINVSTLFGSISSFGVYHVTIKFLPYFNSKENKHHGFLWWIFFLGFAGFLITTIAFIALKQQISELYNPQSPLFASNILYIIPLGFNMLLFGLFDYYLKSLSKNVIPPFVNEFLFRILNTLIIVPYFFNYLNFEEFVLLYVTTNSLSGLVLLIYTYKIGQLFLKPIKSKKIARLMPNMINYGIFLQTSNITNSLINNLDILFIAYFISMSGNGIYSTMLFLASILLFPYRALSSVSGPLISNYWKNNNRIAIQDLYSKVSTVGLIAGVVLFALLWTNFQHLFNFIPKEYEAGKYIFLFIALARLTDIYGGINTLILTTSKKFRVDFYFNFIYLAAAFLTMFFLIPKYQLIGASIAVFITFMVVNFTRFIYLYFVFGFNPLQWKQTIPLLALMAVFILNEIIPVGQRSIFIDLPIRSLIVLVLILLPVYYFKVSDDFNFHLNRMIKKYLNLNL